MLVFDKVIRREGKQKHDFLEIGGLRLEFNSDDTPEDAIAEAIELYNQTGCYYYEGHFHE
jgi:hypothetical protein